MNKQRHKEEVPQKLILTNRGLMKCTVADFDPGKYKGINKSRAQKRKQPKA